MEIEQNQIREWKREMDHELDTTNSVWTIGIKFEQLSLEKSKEAQDMLNRQRKINRDPMILNQRKNELHENCKYFTNEDEQEDSDDDWDLNTIAKETRVDIKLDQDWSTAFEKDSNDIIQQNQAQKDDYKKELTDDFNHLLQNHGELASW